MSVPCSRLPTLPPSLLSLDMRSARNHPPPDRGRSRDVSPIALARQASEERRILAPHQLHHHHRVMVLSYSEPLHRNATCSSLKSSTLPPSIPTTSSHANQHPVNHQLAEGSSRSFDTMTKGVALNTAICAYNSHEPPSPSSLSISRTHSPEGYRSSPPRSLEDQMQEAYALDNMHLARVLFLKLRGIDVTSDDDPRIAQVRDEDFCFVPENLLKLDEECERAIREGEQREKERREKIEKARKLKEMEKVWDEQARRMRTEKQRVQRLKAEAVTLRETQRQDYKTRTRGRGSPRDDCSWKATPTPHAVQPDTRFQYDLMRPLPSSLPNHNTVGSPASRRMCRPTMTRAPPSAVSFRDVISRMEGQLFPNNEPVEESSKQTKAQRDLLETLLKVVEWEDGERRRMKGKDRLSMISTSSVTMCIACSVSSSLNISRSNSWAWSDSASSISTAMTSPPASPSRGDKAPLPPLAEELNVLVHSCRRWTKSSSVPLWQTPLAPQQVSYLPDGFNGTSGRIRRVQRTCESQALMKRVRRSVSTMVDIACKMQQSYIRSIQFTMVSPIITVQSTALSPQWKPRRPAAGRLRPEGYRARPSDVSLFVTPSLNNTTPCQVIPLRDPHPSPPPPRVFPPLAPVTPSPLRPRQPPMHPEWRMRPVANPVVLRLRALQNHLCSRGIQWEGRAHQGSLGCGREKLTGVAFDGLGGSPLALRSVTA